MTEQKPVAWLFESNIGSSDYRLYASYDEPESFNGRRRDIRPVYTHPPAPAAPVTTPEVEATVRPYAWAYTWAWGDVLTRHDPTGREDVGCLRNLKPLYEHPPAPAAPVTTPEVEAARRQALRWILDRLVDENPHHDGIGLCVSYGILRDLVGQPRVPNGRGLEDGE
jgi:hypothetical protein